MILLQIFAPHSSCAVKLTRSRQRTIQKVAEIKSYNGVLWSTCPELLKNNKYSTYFFKKNNTQEFLQLCWFQYWFGPKALHSKSALKSRILFFIPFNKQKEEDFQSVSKRRNFKYNAAGAK